MKKSYSRNFSGYTLENIRNFSPESINTLNKQRIKEFNLMNFTFKYNDSSLLIRLSNPCYDINDIENIRSIFCRIEQVVKIFNSVLSKGYITEKTEFPVVDIFIKCLSINSEEDKKTSFRCKYWVYNLILTELYYLASKIVKEIEEDSGKVLEYDDLLHDYRSIVKELYISMDSCIKRIIQKKGISIVKNVYVGFDTEFEMENEERNQNKLLSYQIAMNQKVYIKLARTPVFLMGKRDSNTGVFWKESPSGNSIFLDIIEKSIASLCIDIRKSFCLETDIFTSKMVSFFNDKGVEKITTEDFIIFGFDYSRVLTYIGYNENGGGFTLRGLLDKIKELIDTLEKNPGVSLLEEFLCKEGVHSRKESISIPFDKRLQRVSFYYNKERIYLTNRVNVYINIHLAKADLSILKDFDEFKYRLSIVGKEFVTIMPIQEEYFNVHIRDTMLLTPAISKGLDAIGRMYGPEFEKVKIPREYYSKMGLLLKTDRELFDRYAVQDSIITLKHVNELEKFSFKNVHQIGVPLTLSSIGKKFVLKHWRDNEYSYQKCGKIKIGNPSQLFTPKGLDKVGSLGLNMALFIASYKGGRNESFMYGIDRVTKWYDYDLTSAYTTCMAYLGDPDYKNLRELDDKAVVKLTPREILNGYFVIKTKFSFPDSVKFPSIPCYADETTTVYPLNGEGFVTGFEYLLALSQGCEFKNSRGVYIPFKISSEYKESSSLIGGVYYDRSFFKTQPFYDIIKIVQGYRRDHVKGSLGNNLWKTIGNSIYGSVVSGMSDKKAFNIKSGELVRIEASEMTNPILASYTTAITRTVIGECLHNIQLLGGKVISVTTDGFITDIDNLESRLMGLEKGNTMLKLYSFLRRDLTDGLNCSSLELKKESLGIISWTTRGQLGLEKGLKATTGFQSGSVLHKTMIDEFTRILQTDDKRISYIQSSLRGSKEIFLKGGHATMRYKDQSFRMVYDNRRVIIEENQAGVCNDPCNTLLDSKPVLNKKVSSEMRQLATFNRSTYDKNTHTSISTSYKNTLETAIRTFVRGYLSEDPLYGLKKGDFDNYSDIIHFIKSFKTSVSIRLTKSSISNLKTRKMIKKTVPFTDINREFAEYVRERFPHFSTDDFFKN